MSVDITLHTPSGVFRLAPVAGTDLPFSVKVLMREIAHCIKEATYLEKKLYPTPRDNDVVFLPASVLLHTVIDATIFQDIEPE